MAWHIKKLPNGLMDLPTAILIKPKSRYSPSNSYHLWRGLRKTYKIWVRQSINLSRIVSTNMLLARLKPICRKVICTAKMIKSKCLKIVKNLLFASRAYPACLGRLRMVGAEDLLGNSKWKVRNCKNLNKKLEDGGMKVIILTTINFEGLQ